MHMFENLEKRKRRREQPSDRSSTDAEFIVNPEASELEELKMETPEAEDVSSALSGAAPSTPNGSNNVGVNTRRSTQAVVSWGRVVALLTPRRVQPQPLWCVARINI